MRTGVENINRNASWMYPGRTREGISFRNIITTLLDYGKVVLLVLDLILLTLSLCLSGLIVKGIEWSFSETFISGIIFFNLLWVFLSYLKGIYKNLLLVDSIELFTCLGKLFAGYFICSWFFILVLLDGFNHVILFLFFVGFFYALFGTLLVINRVVLLNVRKKYKDKVRRKKNIFIIGDSSSCELLESYIQENQCDLRLKGYFNDQSQVAGNDQNLSKYVSLNFYKKSEQYAENALEDLVLPVIKDQEENGVIYGAECSVFNQPESGIPTKPIKNMQNVASLQERPIRGDVLECVRYFGEMEIDEVYCSLQSLDEEKVRYLIREADKHMIRIKFLPDFYQIFRRRSSIHYLGSVPVISIREEPLTIDSNVIIKRLFDFSFSLIVIVFVLSWLSLIIGLLIKIESPGPVFFKQNRSGINNKPFKVYKFRSMRKVKGISEDSQAVKNDVRLTRVGSFLRKTSIDELPQFFNVLLGNMSVVGPRPHMLSHTDKFSKEIDTYMVRHFAKQGITGWAQVNGFRGETRTKEAIEQRVQHDIWYIENWSLILDLKIVFLTIKNVFIGEENAY